jgi:hypothetical protein
MDSIDHVPNLRDFITQFYSRHLSVSELAERRARLISDYRVRHEIVLEHPELASEAYKGGKPLHANSRLAPSPEGSSLGAPYKDVLGWVEDQQCPFCPPYNAPLDTEFV